MTVDERPFAARLMSATRRGAGSPWDVLHLRDVDGEHSVVSLAGVTDRGPDGHFYAWLWCGTRLRFFMPLALPWSMMQRRRWLLARTMGGEIVGPFEITQVLTLRAR